MMTLRTKLQLLVFVVITLLGVSYVGAKYAQLDRLIIDDSYTVVAHFPESGGIFAGGEVTYRGVNIGNVDKLVLTDEGVDLHLSIKNDFDAIPADTLAVVGNRSAVGEQYVELQPEVDSEPFLGEDSEIPMENARVPIRTEKLLTDISNTVESVDKDALRTTVEEMGLAFGGTGEDLQRMIDSGNEFIEAANANFDITTALIEDSNVVLRGQVASASAIRRFAQDMSLFSGAFAGADRDLREVIDNGSATAIELRTFLEENEVELGDLVKNLVISGEVVVANLPGVEQILVLYPYVVEGGFTVVSKDPDTGFYDAHFGLILQQEPHVCNKGYEGTNQRPPSDGSNAPMNTEARCEEPAAQSNARGAQHAPKRAAPGYDAPVVASYDPDSGKLRWGSRLPAALTQPGSVAPPSLGEESWKWLYLQPLMAQR